VGLFIARYRNTGSVSPAKFGGYKGYALVKYADQIQRWLAEQPDLRLREVQARLAGIPRVKERRNQLVGTLSGGEQQMVAMGRGLVQQAIAPEGT
jgi:ABC-type sugar transport system ATPase subunit